MVTEHFISAIAAAPQPGQEFSGDDFVLETIPTGLFIGVIDGLGHGIKAHQTTQVAVEVLRRGPHDDLLTLMRRSHTALTTTRGAVITLASLNVSAGRLDWLGVGNVTAVLIPGGEGQKRERRHLLLRGGIVGYRLPPLKLLSESIKPNDTLLFVTDGIRSGFMDDIPYEKDPQNIADYVLKHHSRGTDDALVLVVRYQ